MNKLFFLTTVILFSFFKVHAQSYNRIEAENYSAMNGVQTESTSDAGGGLNVGWIDQGDWMDYSVNVPVAGSYKIGLRVATPSSGSQLKFKNAAGTVLATVNLTESWGGQTWITVYTHITLVQGTQTIRIESSASPNFNLNWIEVSQRSVIRVEAEAHTSMSGVQTESAWGDGGGTNLSYIDPGDWMDYSVNVPIQGIYTLHIRVATSQSNGQLQVKNTGGTVLSTINFQSTGGWQTWQTQTTTLTLSAGTNHLRFQSTGTDAFNLNWYEFEAPSGTGTPNDPPTLNAGIDKNINLPTNTVQFDASASDADGFIASYLWTKVTGPLAGTFSSTSIANPSVSGLTEGTYVFRLTVTDNGGATAYDDITVNVVQPATNAWSYSGNTVDASQHFIGTNNPADLVFKTNGQKQARITTEGLFLAKKIQVTQSNWADFVFDPKYRLRPLSEVEQFIKKHKHLPDVPSEKQVTTEGLNVGDNQAVLLRKIEELTLYMIEQNKQIAELKKEVKALKSKTAQKKK